MTTWKMMITGTVAALFLLIVGTAPAVAQQGAGSPAPSTESKAGGLDTRDGTNANADRSGSGNVAAPQRNDDAAGVASPRTADNERSFNPAWLLVPLALVLGAVAFRAMRRDRGTTRNTRIDPRV